MVYMQTKACSFSTYFRICCLFLVIVAGIAQWSSIRGQFKSIYASINEANVYKVKYAENDRVLTTTTSTGTEISDQTTGGHEDENKNENKRTGMPLTNVNKRIYNRPQSDADRSQKLFLQKFRDNLILGKINRTDNTLMAQHTDDVKEISSFQYQREEHKYDEKRPRIVHVWSPYVIGNGTEATEANPFFPLNHAQNVTWESMYRAQQDYNRYNDDAPVHIYCAVLWTDVEKIQNHNPPLCKPGKYNHLVVMNRSTHTEYPSLKPPIHYPFLQDMFAGALNDLQVKDRNHDAG